MSISMDDIRQYVGRNDTVSLNDPDVRALAGKPHGSISLADFLNIIEERYRIYAGRYFSSRVGWYQNGLCISGDYLVFGDFYDDEKAGNAGTVYIFKRVGHTWYYKQKLFASDAALGDSFGCSVSMHGTTIVVGAVGDDDAGSSTGSAYVFDLVGDQWTQTQKLVASDRASTDRFGQNVDIHDNTIIIGSPYDDDIAINSGSAYIYVRTGSVGTTWSFKQKIRASDPVRDRFFGTSVKVYKDRALVYASTRPGRTYIFSRTGTTWSQEQVIVGETNVDDRFGEAFDLNDDTILIGSSYCTVDGTPQVGRAYTYTHNGTSWVREQTFTPDTIIRSLFGTSVSISETGDKIAIGALVEPTGTFSYGAVYVYHRENNTWVQNTKTFHTEFRSFGRFVNIRTGDLYTGGGTLRYSTAHEYVFIHDSNYHPEYMVWSVIPPESFESYSYGGKTWYGFSSSIALGTDTMIIGADKGGLNTGAGGIVMPFLERDGIWVHDEVNDGDNVHGTQNGRFGYACALNDSEDILAVTAPFAGNGYIVLLNRNADGTWNPDPSPGSYWQHSYIDGTGYAIATSGNIMAVTARGDGGAIFLYDMTVGQSSEVIVRPSDNQPPHYEFGGHMGFDGTTLVTTSRYTGASYVFEYTNSTLVETQKMYAGGESCDVDGDVMVFGIRGDSSIETTAGSVRIYRKVNGTWTYDTKIAPAGERKEYGYKVVVKGNIVVASAPYEGSLNNGAIYVHDISGPTPVLIKKITPPDLAEDELFGQQFAFDGSRIVVPTQNGNIRIYDMPFVQ